MEGARRTRESSSKGREERRGENKKCMIVIMIRDGEADALRVRVDVT